MDAIQCQVFAKFHKILKLALKVDLFHLFQAQIDLLTFLFIL
jgi:hypothetical protein